jgi:phosphatidylglycerophosphate synthase
MKKSFRDQLQQLIYRVIDPFVKGLIKIGLTPNAVTLIGFILNIGVVIIFVAGAENGHRGDLSYVGWAGALTLFAGLFDMLDGQVARLGNMKSRFGAMFDSVLDRYSEMVLFFGICYYLIGHHYFFSSIFAFIALIGSMMVSYTRARAEGLGIECKGGLMQRPERIVLISVTAIACGVTAHFIGGDYKLFVPGVPFHIFETISIFTFPLFIMAVMTNITAIGRLRESKKALDAQEAAEKEKQQSKPGAMKVVAMLMLLLLPVFTFGGNGKGKGKGNDPVFPVPTNIPHMMFYMQRTPNINTIIYDLNLKDDGTLDDDEPVNIYWIRYQDGGEKKGLSYIQRKFAYGLKSKSLGGGKYELHSVAYAKRSLYLMKPAGGNDYHMYTKIGTTMAILNRIYLQIEGGSFWVPNVVYVELKGTDPATGKEVVERFKP